MAIDRSTSARRAVFLGPSTFGLDLNLGAARRPPVRLGDLFSLPGIEKGDWTIAIIDGEFGQSLAVTVAEIREALSFGNRVVGGASMGALRAVECAPLGMEGVGWTFEQYRDGMLFSDAEVALTYDGETYQPFTVPMVNLRWLSLMLEPGGGGPAVVDFLSRASAVPFRRRDLATLRDLARDCLGRTAASRWLDQLREERVAGWDRKQADALAVIAALNRPRVRPSWFPAPPLLPPALQGLMRESG